jgi:23S rRNA (guanosine2251-2'-O)-methyltransferase
MLDDQEPEVNHQGVILEASAYTFADLADVVDEEGNVLVLDHLQDPQNVGTLLRAADAAGVAGVIIPPTAPPPYPGCGELLRGRGRSIWRLLLYRTLERPGQARSVWALDHRPGWWPGFTGPVFTDVPTPAVLVVGSEGPGLTANIRKRCQLIVSLPMRGQVESLNAATAGSIALFDLVRRGQ